MTEHVTEDGQLADATDAIFAISKAIQAAQCKPPIGAPSPFELQVVIHLDEKSQACMDGITWGLNEISTSLDRISDSLDVIGVNIKKPKV
jgi:hypothetical protein